MKVGLLLINYHFINCSCGVFFADLLKAHETHAGALGTMLVKRVSAAKASECGEVVADAKTNELLHYTERPVRHHLP